MLDNQKYKELSSLNINNQFYSYYDIKRFKDSVKLPYSIRLLLEGALRNYDEVNVTIEHIEQLINWETNNGGEVEIPFVPGRVIFQDYTGIPAIVDLAALRSKMKELGDDPKKINPKVRVDLVIDHSLIVESSSNSDALHKNLDIEYKRNQERYSFVRWAQQAFENFYVVPPGSGIVHQVNLEYLASSVLQKENLLYPDTLVGTDSHTTMINGLGIVGWGVGGIEAEAAMLGLPLYLLNPEVIGIKITGALAEGVTATDLALTITEMLRKTGVVGKFVEYFGDGLSHLSLADRATIANMAPEYGATLSFFPFDYITEQYLLQTGRTEAAILASHYHKAQGLYREDGEEDPIYTSKIVLDLTTIEPSLAGPKRPQDRVPLTEMKHSFQRSLKASIEDRGYSLTELEIKNQGEYLKHGDVVLAAITSCTNTSNPSVMIAAGLVAKRANSLGLKIPSYVKTSLTPGSKMVEHYLKKLGLLDCLEKLGFYIDGFGCGACCGNSGPLNEKYEKDIHMNNLVVSSVLSGNRNFEGRIHPSIKANYLASPPLVVLYALAGTTNIDICKEAIGTDSKGNKVYFKDLWPSSEEIEKCQTEVVNLLSYKEQYRTVHSHEKWEEIEYPEGDTFSWDIQSTYIQKSPFLDLQNRSHEEGYLNNLYPLLVLGDSITTDHISPAGNIQRKSPAGHYLLEREIPSNEFNSYGARRGNHELMVRGTFANIRIRNKLLDNVEGGYTKFLPTQEVMSIYEATEKYKQLQIGLFIVAGKEYGTGSSRDWAAKGTKLLGVRLVLAESFERIHRSNLVGMGILPITYAEDEIPYVFTGEETIQLKLSQPTLHAKQCTLLNIIKADGTNSEKRVIIRLDNSVEVETYLKGGLLPYIISEIKTTV
ncbi:aconitate hydratase AcnA [Psychrobacillus antarcticus]|uniref:aconitate hydratase AcnA n=1 Tax=Psychrobacillus antarcticus TaxID=2879115 RepID=UPI0024082F42|nr:aconitate hydratase AcnA [Psychrobacillus antarcticus]